MHQISARTLPEPYLPAPDLFAYCPTMDLIATVSQRDSADVWRLNGQRVFGAKLGKDEEDNGDDGDVGRDGKGFVRALGWRRDGESWFGLATPLFLLDHALCFLPFYVDTGAM